MKNEIQTSGASDSSSKSFRRPLERNRRPMTASDDEFQEAIDTGIKDAESKKLTSKELKSKTDIVNNWIEIHGSHIHLNASETKMLVRLRENAENAFGEYICAIHIWGDRSTKEKVFRDAAQSYLQFARTMEQQTLIK